MKFSFFSLVMSIIFFNLFMILIALFKKQNKFIKSFSIFPIILLVILSISRLLFNFEFKNAIDINSRSVFPRIMDFLRTPIYAGSSITKSKGLLLIWLTGIIILVFKNISLYTGFKKDLSKMIKTERDEDLMMLQAIKKKLNVRKNISIYRSDEILSPIVVGVFEYNIYLPNMEIREDDLNNILLHEVNHIIGRDNLKKMLILILKIVFWWNPFIYYFNQDVDHILEIQCDLRTTKAMAKDERVDYLETILNMIQSTRDKTSNIAVVKNSLQVSRLYNNDDSKIKQRFTLVLDYQDENIRNRTKKILACSAMLLVFLSSYMFTIKPLFLPDEEGLYIKEEDGDIETDIDFIFKEKNKGNIPWDES